MEQRLLVRVLESDEIKLNEVPDISRECGTYLTGTANSPKNRKRRWTWP